MKEFAQRIRQEGKVYPGNILKVDSFLNHQIDPVLMREIGKEFHRLFAEHKISKILTVEASGIAMALACAMEFGVPMLFAKKNQTANLSKNVYSASVMSFTHNRVYNIVVDKKYLTKDDTVLIVDDFLAQGNALKGLIDLVGQADATLAGVGIGIEKGFQPGGDLIRGMGVRVESLAIVESMTDDSLTFREE